MHIMAYAYIYIYIRGGNPQDGPPRAADSGRSQQEVSKYRRYQNPSVWKHGFVHINCEIKIRRAHPGQHRKHVLVEKVAVDRRSGQSTRAFHLRSSQSSPIHASVTSDPATAPLSTKQLSSNEACDYIALVLDTSSP